MAFHYNDMMWGSRRCILSIYRSVACYLICRRIWNATQTHKYKKSGNNGFECVASVTTTKRVQICPSRLNYRSLWHCCELLLLLCLFRTFPSIWRASQVYYDVCAENRLDIYDACVDKIRWLQQWKRFFTQE